MNYYPFHMGDYATATRHLSWDEDAAYRRLLDAYYTHEKPLPLELRAVYRLVIATTEAQREAVETVLREFFVETPDGWVNRRAEAELAAMREKSKANEQRDEHERDRMRRHRERRAEMFAALRDRGVVPAWDVPMKELQRIHDETCGEPATHLKREQGISGDAPATAIPTPTPTPIVKKENTPLPPKGGEELPGFAAFWAAWPKNDKKSGKGKCLEAWRKAKAEAVTDTVLAHVERMKASPSWTKDAGQFIPMPITYVNQRRWEGAEDTADTLVPQWCRDAGFLSVLEASNARCFAHNATEFRDGKRIQGEFA